MRKIVIRRPGGFGKIELADVPPPAVEPGTVRVRVHAAGVNFADCVARMGLYASARQYAGWPLTPGFEVAGIVDAVGTGVPQHVLGTKVIGLTRFGGYADQAVIPLAQIFDLPATLSFEEGAAFPVIFLTAYYALHELACPPADSAVLIHSAAGGVGSALVQLCRAHGNFVVAIVGSRGKAEMVRSLGANGVIVKCEQDWRKEARSHVPEGYSAVFDASGTTLRGSYSLLAPRGRLIAYGAHGVMTKSGALAGLPLTALRYALLPRFNPLALTNDNKSIMGFNLSYLFDETELMQTSLRRILALLQDGTIKVPPITRFPLENAAEAHEALQSGATIGKLILTCRASA
ncbi:MAG: synaptic vesicle rane protein [Methylobacteriaceae bacterium]|nr:synaptic vesicle rane protein [Methylobacteriaceae bacterium]